MKVQQNILSIILSMFTNRHYFHVDYILLIILLLKDYIILFVYKNNLKSVMYMKI